MDVAAMFRHGGEFGEGAQVAGDVGAAQGGAVAGGDGEGAEARQALHTLDGGAPVGDGGGGGLGEFRLLGEQGKNVVGFTVTKASPTSKVRSDLRHRETWPAVWPGVGSHSQPGIPGTEPSAGSMCRR